MAFLHPGDLSLSQWLLVLLFWGGLALGTIVVVFLLIKFVVNKLERRQGEEK
jgi:uncharacterized membrane protein YjfL (UPF0719 family)